MDQIYIQVRFKKEYNGIEYNDALYFTEEDYKDVLAADIEAMKEERLTSFKAIIDNPPVEVEPTKEELIVYKEELLKLSLEVQEKIYDTELKIVEKEAEKDKNIIIG